MANVSKLFGNLSSAEFKALDKKALAGVSIKNTENALTARLDAQLASGKSEGIMGAVTNFGLGFQSIGGLDAVKNANAFRLATGMSATGAIGLAGAVGAGAGVVSGVMDGTGPIDGGLGGLATGVLASAAVVGGAVMTKQGRKIVDRVGRAKGGKIAERYNNRTGGFDSFADKIHGTSKGEGDLWNNFARGAYMDKSVAHTARSYKNPTFKKPIQAGSENRVGGTTTPLQQTTAGANSGSVAERSKRNVVSSPKQSLIGRASENISSLFKPRQNETAVDLPSEAAKRLRGQELFLTDKEARTEKAGYGFRSGVPSIVDRGPKVKRNSNEVLLLTGPKEDLPEVVYQTGPIDKDAAKKQRQAAINEKTRATRAAKKRQKEEEEKSRITMKQGSATPTVNPFKVNKQNQAQRQESARNFAQRIRSTSTGRMGAAVLNSVGDTERATQAAQVQTAHDTRNFLRRRERR